MNLNVCMKGLTGLFLIQVKCLGYSGYDMYSEELSFDNLIHYR